MSPPSFNRIATVPEPSRKLIADEPCPAPSGPRLDQSVAKAIDGHLRNDET